MIKEKTWTPLTICYFRLNYNYDDHFQKQIGEVTIGSNFQTDLNVLIKTHQ